MTDVAPDQGPSDPRYAPPAGATPRGSQPAHTPYRRRRAVASESLPRTTGAHPLSRRGARHCRAGDPPALRGEGGHWLGRPPGADARARGDAQGSSGDMQEPCFGLAPGMLRRIPCAEGVSDVHPIGWLPTGRGGSCPMCPVEIGSCGWSGWVYARSETWISAALPDRGCTEGLCFTRSSRSRPAQRTASGGGS